MNSVRYVGMDVHRDTISVAVLDESGRLLMQSVLATRAAAILDFIHGLRGTLQVTCEEGTHSAWLYDVLVRRVEKLVVCNPRKDALLKSGSKSDAIDARKLAELLRAEMLSGVYHGETSALEVQQRARSYSQLTEDTNQATYRWRVWNLGIKVVMHHRKRPSMKTIRVEVQPDHLQTIAKVKRLMGMRKSLAVGLLLGVPGAVLLAKAQEEPSKFDLYGGYYYARINVNANVPGIAPSATYIGQGGGGQLEYNVTNRLGLVGDLSGFYATSAGNGAFAGAFLSYVLGPRVNFRYGKFTPFVQAFFGGVRTTDGIANQPGPRIILP